MTWLELTPDAEGGEFSTEELEMQDLPLGDDAGTGGEVGE
jgi:hypothetical protein